MKETVRSEREYSKIYDLFLTFKRTETFVITKKKLLLLYRKIAVFKCQNHKQKVSTNRKEFRVFWC